MTIYNKYLLKLANHIDDKYDNFEEYEPTHEHVEEDYVTPFSEKIDSDSFEEEKPKTFNEKDFVPTADMDQYIDPFSSEEDFRSGDITTPDDYISRASKNMINIANKIINKYAEEPIIGNEYAFQEWVNNHYKQADKNRVLNKINESVDDLNSCVISLHIKNKTLKSIAIINGSENAIANKIVLDDMFPLIKNDLSKFPEGSKFEGWIRYPAK